MNLKHLLQGIPVKIYRGSQDIEITGLSCNSKLTAPGNIFIAKRGHNDDGTKYVNEAVQNGAKAIVTDLPNPFIKNVTQIISDDIPLVEAFLAAKFYDNPSNKLFTVGITGTNGKTTTSYLVKHLLDSFSSPCGVLGTLGCVINGNFFNTTLTTPDVITTQKFLQDMVKGGCSSAVMEVSSIGLDQGRVALIDYDAAIFSNLTQDHLDYHKTLDKYAESKSVLFKNLKPSATAILNGDSPWSQYMCEGCRSDKLTYGCMPSADLYAHDIDLSLDGCSLLISFAGKSLKFKWDLIGRCNVYNCLAALGVAISYGIDFDLLPGIAASFPCIPGRFERIQNSGGKNIFVDYAHTPDALEQSLKTIREFARGKIITVFGCGGDRDKSKRPIMARNVEKYSDLVFVTSDNPRNEDPLLICREIESGFVNKNFFVEIDRKKAIERAIEVSDKDDIIFIAGKGHETYQIFAYNTIKFDDRKIAQDIANRYG